MAHPGTWGACEIYSKLFPSLYSTEPTTLIESLWRSVRGHGHGRRTSEQPSLLAALYTAVSVARELRGELRERAFHSVCVHGLAGAGATGASGRPWHPLYSYECAPTSDVERLAVADPAGAPAHLLGLGVTRLAVVSVHRDARVRVDLRHLHVGVVSVEHPPNCAEAADFRAVLALTPEASARLNARLAEGRAQAALRERDRAARALAAERLARTPGSARAKALASPARVKAEPAPALGQSPGPCVKAEPALDQSPGVCINTEADAEADAYGLAWRKATASAAKRKVTVSARAAAAAAPSSSCSSSDDGPGPSKKAKKTRRG